MERKTLTKSLHTVTATVNVAAYLQANDPVGRAAYELVRAALDVLGYGGDWTQDDPTVAMCIKQLRKMGLAS